MGISDHEELVQLMQKKMSVCLNSIEDTLSYITQDARRRSHPSDRDLAEGVEKLPFPGDNEDGPPLAWVITWRGKYSNTYGEDIPNSLKAWGYGFWDGKRLVKSGWLKAEPRAF